MQTGFSYDASSHFALRLYLFTGKERDQESGNDYFGTRYYASRVGRFNSPDPSMRGLSNPTNPQSFNLYSYTTNNPLALVDPSGLDPCAHDEVMAHASSGTGDGSDSYSDYDPCNTLVPPSDPPEDPGTGKYEPDPNQMRMTWVLSLESLIRVA